MRREKIKHHALIPAKEKSARCQNKNWRNFIKGYCLVDFTLKTIPIGVFKKIIVSTDRADYGVPKDVEKHKRNKSLASRESCILELIKVIMHEYQIADKDYLWLLNPTSPFRLASDYRYIAKVIEKKLPSALISVKKISPFIWKDNTPLFETKGKRRNTDNFREKYSMENGMFYVFNAGDFRRNGSWYAKRIMLYKQDTLLSSVDIDTERDFKHAQHLKNLWEVTSGSFMA